MHKIMKNKFGFFISILSVALTVLTFGIAFFTPPLSGPYCMENCFEYPFSDIASRFPRDYFWMYAAMLQLLAYVALMTCIHRYSAEAKKAYSQIGLIFASMAAFVLLFDYFVQVSVIQPSLVNDETDGIALWSQYNAHGIFIALEELGYFLMSIAFFCMAPVFAGKGIENVIRWIFVASFLLTVAALAWFSSAYGIHREYRFEIAAITINWLALIVSGTLLAVVFKRVEGEQE